MVVSWTVRRTVHDTTMYLVIWTNVTWDYLNMSVPAVPHKSQGDPKPVSGPSWRSSSQNRSIKRNTPSMRTRKKIRIHASWPGVGNERVEYAVGGVGYMY